MVNTVKQLRSVGCCSNSTIIVKDSKKFKYVNVFILSKIKRLPMFPDVTPFQARQSAVIKP